MFAPTGSAVIWITGVGSYPWIFISSGHSTRAHLFLSYISYKYQGLSSDSDPLLGLSRVRILDRIINFTLNVRTYFLVSYLQNLDKFFLQAKLQIWIHKGFEIQIRIRIRVGSMVLILDGN